MTLDNPLVAVLVLGPLAVSVLVESRRFRGDAERRVRDPTYRRLQVWQIAGLVLGVLLAKKVPGADLPGGEWLWAGAGCAAGLAGVALRLWAIRTLGSHFTRDLQVAGDHRVVGSGPYRRVRHPSYAGAILLLGGIGLGLGNALALAACFLLPAAGYVQRIRDEEALLLGSLGEPYAEYARRTRRLMPGLW